MSEKLNIEVIPNINYDKLFAGTFFEELAGEIDIIEPNNEISENETVIDQMTDLEKRLYSLYVKYGRTSGMMSAQARYEQPGEERDQMITAGKWAENASKSMLEILWVIIRERLKVPYGLVVGVRVGFQIVSFIPPTKVGIEEILKGLGAHATIVRLDKNTG